MSKLVACCVVGLGCGGGSSSTHDASAGMRDGTVTTDGTGTTNSPLVPGGTFYRSFDTAADNLFNNMGSPATVSDFRLDKYEVTLARFRQFVDAGMGTQANPPASGAGARMLNGMANQGGWDPAWNASLASDTAALRSDLACNSNFGAWTDSPGARETWPINCITWFEAFAFCAWDGGFLPTEAEWNYAAAGGSEQRAYAWSSPPSSLTIDCTYANYDPAGGYCNPPSGSVEPVGQDSPKSDGKYGQADLAGNVAEWTLDWASGYVSPCVDCANLTVATARAHRGGGYFQDDQGVRVANRLNDTPDVRDYAIGVRCARSP